MIPVDFVKTKRAHLRFEAWWSFAYDVFVIRMTFARDFVNSAKTANS